MSDGRCLSWNASIEGMTTDEHNSVNHGSVRAGRAAGWRSRRYLALAGVGVIVLGATAGTAAWSVDDKGGRHAPAVHQITEPGDDHGGTRTPSSPRTTEPGDDNGGTRRHVEAGDDSGGRRERGGRGGDKGGHVERRSGRSGSASDDGAGHH
jgi:hypothetical protein